jgi:ATP-dependent exoDNAse (exonuclease V) beta subunit
MPVPPSIFVVGDRKQSIYGFRDAEVSVLGEAAGFVSGLRAEGEANLSISHSFRSVPRLLAFANDLFSDVDKDPGRGDAFRYDLSDRFPADPDGGGDESEDVLGLAVSSSVRGCASMVASEIASLIGTALVRDRQTGLRRPALPGDIAILFRTRESHREFEQALESLAVPTYVYKGLGFFDAPEIVDIVSVVRFLADPASNLRAAALLRSRFVRLSDPGLRELAPELARALAANVPPVATGRLTHEDRRALDLVRTDMAEWLALADRLPPADLLDRILRDTGYAAETRGPRLAQARENVKKLRALARRLQNRGYLTFARLAGHLERMSAGDESNAVVDALDAVNLMTVHAAKGLEFPVVFVVNLSRGTGAPTPPIRIAPDEPPSDAVAVGDFHAAFDDDVPARDREETKRLLYVAVTRARDRLYLSSLAENGRFESRPGSLGEVLPRSVRELLGRAGQPAGASTVGWTAASGRSHRFRLCPAGGGALSMGSLSIVPETGGEARQMEPDIAPVADASAVARVSVTGLVSQGAAGSSPTGLARREALIAGRLIHRLFQRAGPADSVESLEQQAARLLPDDERHSLGDSAAVARVAAAAYRSMRLRADVRTVLDEAECHYEVPFSLRLEDGNTLVRGVMDCVAVQPSGDIVVLDFKTGVPRPSDAEQLAVYERAARALFPDRRVEARLVYAS